MKKYINRLYLGMMLTLGVGACGNVTVTYSDPKPDGFIEVQQVSTVEACTMSDGTQGHVSKQNIQVFCKDDYIIMIDGNIQGGTKSYFVEANRCYTCQAMPSTRMAAQ